MCCVTCNIFPHCPFLYPSIVHCYILVSSPLSLSSSVIHRSFFLFYTSRISPCQTYTDQSYTLYEIYAWFAFTFAPSFICHVRVSFISAKRVKIKRMSATHVCPDDVQLTMTQFVDCISSECTLTVKDGRKGPVGMNVSAHAQILMCNGALSSLQDEGKKIKHKKRKTKPVGVSFSSSKALSR